MIEDLPKTEPMVPLSVLVDLARHGQAMRKAQKAYFTARRNMPHVPADELFWAARQAEATFDTALANVLGLERKRTRPGLPGFSDG